MFFIWYFFRLSKNPSILNEILNSIFHHGLTSNATIDYELFEDIFIRYYELFRQNGKSF